MYAYCVDRLDGLCADGCSLEFVACLGEHGSSYDCLDGLKFDIDVAACQQEYPSFVKQPVTSGDFLDHFGKH
uniref:Chitin-binding type-2 domain-containing protein n=1 Tax=Loa loa TaxID=7209 RepID=A0A1I7VVV9_LOALO